MPLQQVISAGTAFLRSQAAAKQPGIARDIALSVAVAHQNLALAYRAHPDRSLHEAYDHAIKGLRLLHDMDIGGRALKSRLKETMLVCVLLVTSVHLVKHTCMHDDSTGSPLR